MMYAVYCDGVEERLYGRIEADSIEEATNEFMGIIDDNIDREYHTELGMECNDIAVVLNEDDSTVDVVEVHEVA